MMQDLKYFFLKKRKVIWDKRKKTKPLKLCIKELIFTNNIVISLFIDFIFFIQIEFIWICLLKIYKREKKNLVSLLEFRTPPLKHRKKDERKKKPNAHIIWTIYMRINRPLNFNTHN